MGYVGQDDIVGILEALDSIAASLKEQTEMMRMARADDRSSEQMERLLAHAESQQKRLSEHIDRCEQRYLERVKGSGGIN